MQQFYRGRRDAVRLGERTNAGSIRRAFDRALPHAYDDGAILLVDARARRAGLHDYV